MRRRWWRGTTPYPPQHGGFLGAGGDAMRCGIRQLLLKPVELLQHYGMLSRQLVVLAGLGLSRRRGLVENRAVPKLAWCSPAAVMNVGDRKSRKVGGALYEQAKVGDGFLSDFNDRSCECTILYHRDKEEDEEEEDEEIAEIDIGQLCFEQARAIAEQDWTKRQAKPDVTTASSPPASESALVQGEGGVHPRDETGRPDRGAAARSVYDVDVETSGGQKP
jgi:hypothetical protein